MSLYLRLIDWCWDRLDDWLDRQPPWIDGRHHPGVLHNLVAHPLLVIWPTAGQWLHERTRP